MHKTHDMLLPLGKLTEILNHRAHILIPDKQYTRTFVYMSNVLAGVFSQNAEDAGLRQRAWDWRTQPAKSNSTMRPHFAQCVLLSTCSINILVLKVSLMATHPEKAKRAGMPKYEKTKLRILAFIAAVLFVWSAISINTIIQHDAMQARIQEEPPPYYTTNEELLEVLIEIVNRLEALENRLSSNGGG
jgi:hypothetical protein